MAQWRDAPRWRRCAVWQAKSAGRSSTTRAAAAAAGFRRILCRQMRSTCRGAGGKLLRNLRRRRDTAQQPPLLTKIRYSHILCYVCNCGKRSHRFAHRIGAGIGVAGYIPLNQGHRRAERTGRRYRARQRRARPTQARTAASESQNSHDGRVHHSLTPPPTCVFSYIRTMPASFGSSRRVASSLPYTQPGRSHSRCAIA